MLQREIDDVAAERDEHRPLDDEERLGATLCERRDVASSATSAVGNIG